MTTTHWQPFEADLDQILARYPRPLEALAQRQIPALVLRNAYPSEHATGLMQRFGSSEAAFSTFNPAGLASPMIDAIIDAALFADNKTDEDTALRALDRALRHEFFMVPLWYNPSYWVAYYDEYEYPDPLPPLDLGYLDFWWFNAEKAETLKAEGALR